MGLCELYIIFIYILLTVPSFFKVKASLFLKIIICFKQLSGQCVLFIRKTQFLNIICGFVCTPQNAPEKKRFTDSTLSVIARITTHVYLFIYLLCCV